ncbi:MAG: antibiotic biosynthesis monooxygenase [Acidobacteriota bacterium]
MIVTAVTIIVKEEHIDDFIQATIENHRNSVQEAGNYRFDFLRCKDDPNRFLLYEAYASDEAAAAHRETPHYLKWRETVADWMAKPREGIAHRVIMPEEKNGW